MTWKHLLKTSTTGLSTNRSRSILTIFGIVIGITSIMLVISLGAGAQNLILGEVAGLGSNTIAVLPGKAVTSPSDAAALYSNSLTAKDLTALENKANVPGLQSVMPVVFGAENASYESTIYSVSIFGATDLIASIFDLTTKEGQFFDSSDVTSLSNTVVIGSKVADNLFANQDPLNQNITISGKNFRVIGVLPVSGGGSIFDFDDMVIMPYTTAQDYLLGIKYFNRIIIEAAPGQNVDEVASDMNLTTSPTRRKMTFPSTPKPTSRLAFRQSQMLSRGFSSPSPQSRFSSAVSVL